MSLNGSSMHGLLDRLHARGCDGQEYSVCRPVARGDAVAVIYTEWCGECGAADWELVGTLEPDVERVVHQ